MTATAASEPRLGWRGIIVVAGGDFACNLYWQTLNFFALFFYTDVLRLSPVTAGAIFALGSIMDAVANIVASLLAERFGGLRRFVRWGAVPLALSFVALFVPAIARTLAVPAIVLASHLGFRLCYALVNIPYVAFSAAVTSDSRQRGTIAGVRMLFGAAAAVAVAWIVRALARNATGNLVSPEGYLVAALLFSGVATAILLIMSAYRANGSAPAASPRPRLIGRAAKALARNRAFVTLATASAAVTVAGGVINASVVYYFADVLSRPLAGPIVVGWMGLLGAGVVPLWLALRHRLGTRTVWQADVVLALCLVAMLGTTDRESEVAATFFFCGMQVAMSGFTLCFWAMLPDTIDWGERRSGVRVEVLGFGAGLLMQKLALAIANLLLGLIYQDAGYSAGLSAHHAAAGAMRATVLLVPSISMAASGLIMLMNPLRCTTHQAVVGRGTSRQGPG